MPMIEKGASEEKYPKTIKEPVDVRIADLCSREELFGCIIITVKHELWHAKHCGSFSHAAPDSLEVQRKELRTDVTIACMKILPGAPDQGTATTRKQEINIEDQGFVPKIIYVKHAYDTMIGIIGFTNHGPGRFDNPYRSCEVHIYEPHCRPQDMQFYRQ